MGILARNLNGRGGSERTILMSCRISINEKGATKQTLEKKKDNKRYNVTWH